MMRKVIELKARKAPVFLLASERSGTNLLRKLVTQHQDVYFGPSPAHFLKHLFYAVPYYGDLKIDANFRALVEDAISLCKIHFSPWLMVLDADDICASYDVEVNERDVILLADYLMQTYAESQGYSAYFCKDNSLHEFTFQILSKIPDAKFIYLHRDPRDFAVSQMKRTLQSNNLYSISKMWRDEQVKCISSVSRLSVSVFKLSYEELIADSDAVIARVCEFLGVQYTSVPKQDVHIQSGVAKEWENLSAPVMKNNSAKYLKFFSGKQIRLIEDVCWSQMRWLGYIPSGQRCSTGYFRIGCEYLFGDVFRLLKLRIIGNEKQDAWARDRSAALTKIRRKLC